MIKESAVCPSVCLCDLSISRYLKAYIVKIGSGSLRSVLPVTPCWRTRSSSVL